MKEILPHRILDLSNNTGEVSLGSTLSRRGRLILLAPIALSIFLGVCFFIKYPSAESRDIGLSLGIQEYSSNTEAKDFILKDINNKLFSLKNYRGQVVMLNFWATWCTPCLAEMPSMEKLYRRFRDKGFVILSVASGDSKDSVSTFINENDITFPALLDPDLTVSDGYKVWALPTTYFIDAKGRIIGKAHGSRDWATKEADQYITSILQVSL